MRITTEPELPEPGLSEPELSELGRSEQGVVRILDMSIELALSRWTNPSPHFSHGQDLRSSDRGLLSAFYGGLVKSSEHNWQNAGRVLVDRTDIRILFDSYQLPLPVRSLDACCREIDCFVREHFFPNWHVFRPNFNASANASASANNNSSGGASDRGVSTEFSAPTSPEVLSQSWINFFTQEIFGGEEYESGSRLLLFFLCPMLPIFPGLSTVGRDHTVPIGRESADILDNFNAQSFLPASVQNGEDGIPVQWALTNSNWWMRRVLWEREQILKTGRT